MKRGKVFRTIVWIGVIVLLLVLAVPVTNLLIAKPSSAKLAKAAKTDALLAKVCPVLQAKCSHCHTADAGVPFYGKVPLASSVIQRDVDRGLLYLDLTECLDERTDAMSEVCLAKVEYALDQNTMPPAPYLAMHWDASLSDVDTEALRDWIRQTRLDKYAAEGLDEKLAAGVIHPVPPAGGLDARKVPLGEKLYNDTRLSKDGTLSCASCHMLHKGGTDQAPVATGVGEAKGPINSPTVYNAVFHVKQFWDGRATDLQDQAAGPVENPIEMAEQWPAVIEKLKKDAAFQAEFKKEFPDGLSKATVTKAIAIFEATLVTPNGPFDKYLAGDKKAISADAQAGYKLFLDNGCATCHVGKAMGGQSFEVMGREKDYFADRGTKVIKEDYGRFNVTQREQDKHKFKVPSLRNIAQTFPYFHDAYAKDLDKAVDVMAEYQYGTKLSEDEVKKIVAFLETLTGEYNGTSVAKIKPKPEQPTTRTAQ